MSFLDNLKETLQDAGWFLGAPVGAAIDVAKAAIPGGTPLTKGAVNAVTTGFDRGTQLFFGDQTGDDAGTQNLLSPGVKKATDALEWVYDNAIAQPLNTALITEQRGVADLFGVEDNASVLDLGSAWDRADEKTGGYDGKGTSIGRESAYLSQGFLGSVFGNHGHPSTLSDEGQRLANEGSGTYGKSFDIQSGMLDATARLFLDPTIVGGKAAKALRVTKTVAGIKDASQIEGKLAQTKDFLFEGWGKRHDQAIGFATAPNRSAGELMAAFPGLREGDGPSVASVIEQTNKGMRAAGKSDEEIADQVKLITRASLGDAGALKNISSDASAAKDALAAMQSHRDDLQTAAEWATKYSDRIQPHDIQDAAQHLNLVKDLEMRGQDYFTSDEFIRMTDARLNAVRKDVDAAEREAARKERIRRTFLDEDGAKSAFGGTADQPMLSSAFGSVKGLEKRAAKERGDYVSPVKRAAVKAATPIGLDGVIQSTAFNKAIRIGAATLTPHLYLAYKGHQLFSKMQQPTELNVHDDQIALKLDNFLKHSKLDGETRLALVSKMASATTEENMRQVAEQSIQLAQESMVKAYREKNPHFTDEVEKLVNTALAKEAAKTSARQAAHTQMFTATKRADGSRADGFIGDDGLLDYRPLFETQKVNSFALPNLRATEHILRRHSNWLTDMAAWAKGDRAPDPNRVKEISEKVFGQAVNLRPGLDIRTANRAQAVNDFVWKSDELAKASLEWFNTMWKRGTLALRAPAYSARVNFESALRFNATLGPAAWAMHASPRLVGFATMGGASRARQAFLSYRDSQELRLAEAGMERIEDAWNAQRLEQSQGLESKIAKFESDWRSKNGDIPIESIDEFIAHERHPEPGVKHMVAGDPEPKLLRITGKHAPGVDENGDLIPFNEKQYEQAKAAGAVESDLDYVYRVVSEADYKRMKASGHLDTAGGHNQPGEYKEGHDVAQDGMFAMAHVDRRLLNEYGRRDEPSVVMKIAVKRGDGWRRDTLDRDSDHFPLPALSTTKRIPFSRVKAVSPRFSGGDDSWIWEENGVPQVIEHDPTGAHADLLKRQAALKAQHVTDDPEYAALKQQHAELAARLDRYRTGGRKGRREVYGAFGEAGQKSIQTRAGEIEGAFQGVVGRRSRHLISSRTTADLLDDSSKLAAKEAQLGNWTYVENTDPLHMQNWLHAVNNQLLQSEIGKKAVALVAQHGATDRARTELAKWMGSSPEGKLLMGRLQWTWANKGDRAGEVIGYVDHYLPTRSLQEKAASGSLKQADLESAVPNVEDRPPVHGEQVAIALGRGSVIGKAVNDGFSRIMAWAGDATEDQLARHPMYAAVYEQEVKRRAEFFLAHPDKDGISLDEIRRVIQDQAHQKARSQIRNYMYDAAHTSDLSHFGRFVSPFIAAWEDTVRKWGRIIKEDPSILGRANQIWNAPNMMGIVVDENGNPVHDRDGFTDNHYIVIPRGISKHLPGGADSNFRISKQAFNLVLQGGLQPGFGPLVAYPVGKIQTASPQLDQVAKLVNPYGPPSSVFDSVAPSVVKQMYDAVNDQSRDHQADTRRMYAQLLTQYRQDPEKFGGKEPTIDDAAKKAGYLGILKVLNRVSQPFPAIYDSPFKLYQDAYHTLKDRERTENHPQGWADQQFIQQYGESYFPLVQSMSLNQGGLGSTQEAVQAVKQYQPLINKFGIDANGQADKTLIRLIVGQEGEGAFNQSAQAWQEQNDIVAGSGQRYRTYKNPVQAQADADAALGWLKYRQFTNTLDAQALQQGLQTYADSPDLVATKQEFVANLTAENPSWGADYTSFDAGQFDRNYQALAEIASSGKFGPMRTDMVGVQQYTALRQALQEELQQYGISEGSQEAQPFRQEFTDAVQALVSQNTQFAEWSYHTFLEHDPLLEPMTSAAQQALSPAPQTDWGFSQ